MLISSNGLKKLMLREGSRATAYKDSRGIDTIGVGHVILPGEEWMLTATLTEKQIEELLAVDSMVAQDAVNAGLTTRVSQPQFDALVSLTFNIGAHAFATSTLLARINAKAPAESITQAFRMWNKPPEIIPRRETEVQQYWSHLHTLILLLLLIAAALMGTGGTLYLTA